MNYKKKVTELKNWKRLRKSTWLKKRNMKVYQDSLKKLKKG